MPDIITNHRSWFIPLVILAELIVYIYYGASLGEWTNLYPKISQSPLAFDPSKRHEVWRFITYMLLHGRLHHIVCNLLIQLLCGIPQERSHGELRVATIYMSGVLGASLASSVYDPNQIQVGASGGVIALIFAQLAYDRRMGIDYINDGGNMGIRNYVVLGVLLSFAYPVINGDVSVACHVGAGAIAGLTMDLMFQYNFRESPRDKIVFWIAVALYCSLMSYAIFWNILSNYE